MASQWGARSIHPNEFPQGTTYATVIEQMIHATQQQLKGVGEVFTVQVGVFQSSDALMSRLGWLRQHKMPYQLAAAPDHGVLLVSGMYPNKQEAIQHQEQLKILGASGTWVRTLAADNHG